MESKILTVILNYKNYEDTKECLDSLLSVNYPNLKVVVVDNCSSDGSAEKLAQEFPQFTHLGLRENYGFAGGNNRVIERYLNDDFDYLFLLNNDTKVDKDIFKNFALAVEKLKDYDVFQAKMLYYYKPELLDSAGLEYGYTSLSFNRGAFCPAKDFSKGEPIFGACAGAAFYSFKAVKRLYELDGEFFDNNFFAYWEDADLSFRLNWRGFKAYYLPEVVVYHKRGKTGAKTFHKMRYWTGRNNLYVLFKNWPSKRLLLYSPFIIFGQLGFMLNSLVSGPRYFLSALRGKIEAFSNYKMMREKGKKIRQDKKQWGEIKKTFVWRLRPKKLK